MGYQGRARGVGDSGFVISKFQPLRCRTLRALDSLLVINLGFRFASPQALRCRHAPRARQIQLLKNLIRGSFSLSIVGIRCRSVEKCAPELHEVFLCYDVDKLKCVGHRTPLQ